MQRKVRVIVKRAWVPPKVHRLVAGAAENSPARALPDGDLNSFQS